MRVAIAAFALASASPAMAAEAFMCPNTSGDLTLALEGMAEAGFEELHFDGSGVWARRQDGPMHWRVAKPTSLFVVTFDRLRTSRGTRVKATLEWWTWESDKLPVKSEELENHFQKMLDDLAAFFPCDGDR